MDRREVGQQSETHQKTGKQRDRREAHRIFPLQDEERPGGKDQHQQRTGVNGDDPELVDVGEPAAQPTVVDRESEHADGHGAGKEQGLPEHRALVAGAKPSAFRLQDDGQGKGSGPVPRPRSLELAGRR